MRILHIVLPGASFYDRKSQQIDRAALAGGHEVIETSFDDAPAAQPAVAHVYGKPGFHAPSRRRFPFPWVASAAPRVRRWRWPRPAEPAAVLSPFEVPEAVDESYFAGAGSPAGLVRGSEPRRYAVGTFGLGRPGVRNMIEQTWSRIQRFREDIDWFVFDTPPSLEDLTLVDAWIDPATTEDDFDGFAAEAIVAGKLVVASRTAVNSQRLEKGRSGFLVPPRDPNELTHAILTALFKPEVASAKTEAAAQTAGKFRPRQRLRVLERIYRSITHATETRPIDAAETGARPRR